MAKPSKLDNPELYLNRELAALEFNRRVLELARDPALPLLERLRFLTICSTNLDEFFEIRVAGVKQRVLHDLAQTEPDRMSPPEVLQRLSELAHRLAGEQYSLLNEQL